jgi:hypothetical protein
MCARRSRYRAPGCVLLAVGLVSVAVAGCGTSGPPEAGLVVTGPGVRVTAPPWPPQYQHLAQRLRRLGLPAGGSEKFHIHALLSVYDQGLLVTVPADIGIDARHHVESSLHTHDQTGVIHMEAPARFAFTLGDFFAVWGVRFGGGTLGALQDDGHNRVWVYINGARVANPARHVLAKDDTIAIGYGTRDSFPHTLRRTLLTELESGKGALPCSSSTRTRKASACLPPAGGSAKTK